MELFQVLTDSGHWYYCLAASDSEAEAALEEWGVEGKIVASYLVDARKPIIMGPL